MKKLLTALLFGTLIACNGTEPPPLDPPPVDPPPEECDLIPDDCLEGEEFDGVACECTPVEPPPVDPPPVERPPPATSDPGDYVHIDRVDGIVNGTPGAPNLLHWCPDAMWRDPEKFAVECSDSVGFFGFTTADDMRFFGNPTGLDLCQYAEHRFIPDLERENRRCTPDHELYDEAFLKEDGTCARSEMRKARLKAFNDNIEGTFGQHRVRSVDMRSKAGTCREWLRNNGGAVYDSIAGFCSSLNKAGVTAKACP